MWDLTVSDVHTFAVGEGQWVVHNAGPCNIDPVQLQKKFDKHATDFGIAGNWNKTNEEAFRQAILDHVDAFPGDVGSLRGQPGVWYLNPSTNLGVFTDSGGNFVSGWKLNVNQMPYYPHIGGG